MRRPWRLLVLLIITFLVITFILSYHSNKKGEKPVQKHPNSKLILLHRFPYYYELKERGAYFTSCSNQCSVTLSDEQIPHVDAVVFYVREYTTHTLPKRFPNQTWVYFNVESPFHSHTNLFLEEPWHYQFNWTMTYRRDSDIYFGYGDFITPGVTLPDQHLNFIVQGKSKFVAWFVSNCQTQSKRDEYVRALVNFIQVDIYGRCGTLKCGKEGDDACLEMLSSDYYFYLAFENSYCKDYITEKLYRTMRKVDIVPVVRGGANYSALLPPGSYINADDFPTVQLLAKFLTKLASDKKEYMKYFEWRNHWKVVEPMPLPFCELCSRLHHIEQWSKVYSSVEHWWQKDVCHDPPPLIVK